MPTRRTPARLVATARRRSSADAPLPAAQADFFRHLVANMRNGVLAIARSGELVFINQEACRIFGLPPHGECVGRPYADVLSAHPDVVRVLSGTFDLATLPNRAELRLKSTDTAIGYTLSLVRDDAGETRGAAFFFKDLTYVEQVVERERLRDRLAAVGEMAAVVAHEIKNPLGGIEVLAGLLRRQAPDNAAVQTLVGDIINEAKLANAIVQEILDFVRPVRLQVEPTLLTTAVQSAVGLADGTAKRGEVTVTLEVPPDLPPVRGDQYQLTQLFANLLINAYEALQGQGGVTLRAREVSRQTDGALLADGHSPVPTLVIEVADTGPGFDAGMAEKIFNPFFTTKPRGSGLGLAIVRKIVDAHDGRIDVTSVLNEGTCFRVMLPADRG